MEQQKLTETRGKHNLTSTILSAFLSHRNLLSKSTLFFRGLSFCQPLGFLSIFTNPFKHRKRESVSRPCCILRIWKKGRPSLVAHCMDYIITYQDKLSTQICCSVSWKTHTHLAEGKVTIFTDSFFKQISYKGFCTARSFAKYFIP